MPCDKKHMRSGMPPRKMGGKKMPAMKGKMAPPFKKASKKK